MKPKRRWPSHLPRLDGSGGKLPPIPMSEALAAKLKDEAEFNHREPRAHALVILQIHFGLYEGDPIRKPGGDA